MRRVVNDDERGVTTVMVALMFTCLIAAAGVGIESSSLAFHRSRVQHSADAGARAVAYDCVMDKPCDPTSAAGTASYFATKNSAGGSVGIPGGVSKAAGKVTVTVGKTIDTHFFSALGINSKNVVARATAIWSKHAVSGPVIPFAVSLCEYSQNEFNTPTSISTATNDLLADTIVKKNDTPLTTAYAAMAPHLTTCSVPEGVTLTGSPGSVSMLPGGIWMSAQGSSTNNGHLIPTAILDSLESVDGWNVNQQEKFSKYLVPGEVMLIAVYAPTDNYAHAGLRTDGSNAAWKGTVNLDIIGYAPFIVSGWCFGTSSCGGANPGANRIAGKFVGTAAPVADFEYDDDGANFGAVKIELIE